MGDCSTAPESVIVAVPGLTASLIVNVANVRVASVGQCNKSNFTKTTTTNNVLKTLLSTCLFQS